MESVYILDNDAWTISVSQADWNDSNTMELYVNPYMGWEEFDQTVTLSVSAQNNTSYMSPNYVVGTPSSAGICILNDEKPHLDTVSHNTTSTLAEIFHDANNVNDTVTIPLDEYFTDTETPNDLTFTYYTSYSQCVVDVPMTVLDSENKLHIHFLSDNYNNIGSNILYVTAADPAGQSTTWNINVYSDRISGFNVQEKAPGETSFTNVDDSDDDWALFWEENTYKLTPTLQNYTTSHMTSVVWKYANWSDRATSAGSPIGSSVWDSETQEQYEYSSNCGVEWSPSTGTFNEIALLPTVTLSSTEAALFTRSAEVTLNWGTSSSPASASSTAKRVGVTSIQSVTWEAVSNGAELTNNPASNGGGLRIFPEKATYNGDVLNKVNVRVALSKAIPTGMSGTVYLDVLDPMNQCTAYGGVDENGDEISLLVGNPYTYSNTPAGTETLPVTVSPGTDNHGNGTLNPVMSLSFQADSASQNAEFTISQANAGDNFIAVALPDVAAIAAVRIGTETESSVLKYNVPVLPGSSVQEFSTSHHTPLLTVWRSLWVEETRFKYDGETARALSYNGWVKQELARAAIDIKIYNTVHEKEVESNTMNLNAGLVAIPNYIQEYEQYHTLPHNSSNFWSVAVFSCFRSDVFQSPFPVPVSHYYGLNSGGNEGLFIYNTIIDGAANTSEAFREKIVLHEILHVLGCADIPEAGWLMSSSPVPSENLLNQSASTVNIQIIQQYQGGE